MFPANTITRQLFFSLGFVVFGIVIISALAILFLQRIRAIDAFSRQILEERNLLTEMIRTDVEFLRFETVNQEFFRQRESSYLAIRDSLGKRLEQKHRALEKNSLLTYFQASEELNTIGKGIETYHDTFRRLVENIYFRGFKDFGLEGDMRRYAHELEKSKSLSLADLLSLRRHEKDFILRKEKLYVIQFNKLADSIVQTMGERSAAAVNLIQYQEHFNKLTEIEDQIGLVPTAGLLGALRNNSKTISNQLQELEELSDNRAGHLIKQSAMTFLMVCIVATLICGLLTYYTSMRLARPIKRLSTFMEKFLISEGLNESEIENRASTNEMTHLLQSFIILTRKVRAQISEIQLKSYELQRQNQELKRLNEELDRFVYSAAHDLKSPLTSMDGLVRLARKEINNNGFDHYFHMMHDSIGRMYGFISDITDYARNKRQNLKIEKTDIAKVINDIRDSLAFLPNAHRVFTDFTVRGEEVFSDKARLEIILNNLISNAYQYMDPAKKVPFLRIEVNATASDVELIVADNGLGIDSKHLPRVFDMFYRATEISKGTGIGLFLVKECVRMLRGRVSVKSVCGEWTSFRIRIPNFTQGHVHIPENEDVVLAESF